MNAEKDNDNYDASGGMKEEGSSSLNDDNTMQEAGSGNDGNGGDELVQQTAGAGAGAGAGVGDEFVDEYGNTNTEGNAHGNNGSIEGDNVVGNVVVKDEAEEEDDDDEGEGRGRRGPSRRGGSDDSGYEDRGGRSRSRSRSRSRDRDRDRSSAGERGRGGGLVNVTARPGDWECPNCNILCFSSRLTCFKCKTAKPGNPEARDGDWLCKNCDINNFASRSVCMKCRAPRPFGGKPAPVARPGDWYCPGCATLVFASRDSCIKCGVPRPAQIRAGSHLPPPRGGGIGGRGEMDHRFSHSRGGFRGRGGPPPGMGSGNPMGPRPGDWICPSCNANVFGTRDSCFKCHAPKPYGAVSAVSTGHSDRDRGGGFGRGRGPPRGPRGPPVTRPGDWACISCNAHNFSNRTTCFKCHAPKPANAVPPGPVPPHEALPPYAYPPPPPQQQQQYQAPPYQTPSYQLPGPYDNGNAGGDGGSGSYYV